jgi:RNA-directed DNA polymerase
VTDRVVQAAVKLVIEPLFEADFAESSYGFRPQRGAHDAIRRIDGLWRRGYRWVVDVDLKSYFDTIPRKPLMERVQRRVRDPKLLRLIRGWLAAGILEDGAVSYPDAGTPQGGVLSPLLSNIYLHEVDQEWQQRGVRAQLVRYADDLVIVCPTEAVARAEYAHLQTVVRALGLTLNTEKTRVVAMREGFEFLGFSYRRGEYARGGKRRETLIKVPRARAVKAIQARLKQVVQTVPLGEAVTEAVSAVNRSLHGWVRYFRISNAEAAVKGLVWHATRQLRVFLRRKYQRKRSQHGRRWPDTYFHEHLGLCTVRELLGRQGAQC